MSGKASCPVTTATPLLRQIAEAIDFAHSAGIVHGDIKPENILLDEGYRTALLSDFGIARHFDTVDKMVITKPIAAIGGTSAYLSPEQLSDNIQSPKSDIYSFGLVAYELLIGRLPFDVKAPLYRQVHARVSGDLIDPEQAHPGIPVRVASALRSILQSSPEKRPRTATAFVSMLEISKKWDVFIAHASSDKDIAEALFDAISGKLRVFLDTKRLLLGDNWDSEISHAQRDALITVVLVSPNVDEAYYARDEVACAIRMARENPHTHRVVPIFLTKDLSHNPPYGLALKQGLILDDSVSIQSVSDSIEHLFQSIESDSRIIDR